MGIDLTFMPFDADHPTVCFSYTLLDCERRSALFEVIGEMEAAHGVEVPDTFKSHRGCDAEGESCYGVTLKTPYGDFLRYVTAGDLKPFCHHEGVTDNYKNAAVWAYLDKLPDETKVALYWW